MKHRYRFTDTEIKTLLKENLVILYDTREQKNEHVLNYFKANDIKFKKQKVDEGDYTGIIEAREDMGIYRDMYFPFNIERKNSVDELIGSIKESDRFENEFDRALTKGIQIHLLVEEKDGLRNMRLGKYRSKYMPKALVAKYNSIEFKYLKGATFEDKTESGKIIYEKIYYAIRAMLKNGDINIDPLEIEEGKQLKIQIQEDVKSKEQNENEYF